MIRPAVTLRHLASASLLLLLLLLSAVPLGAQSARPVLRLELDGVLNDYHTDLVNRALREAASVDAPLLVIDVRTSGARLSSALQIARRIADSAVPVAVAVRTPAGEPAGAWLSAAAHIAVLEQDAVVGPARALGAVTPGADRETRSAELAAQRALLDSWQQRHGRDLQWLRDGLTAGVRFSGAAAAPAFDAVIAPLVDVAALAAGRTVTLADGSQRTITIETTTQRTISPTAFESVRLALADPTVVFVLLILLLLAIIGEIVSPTFGLLSTAALLFLLLASVGIWALPVHWIALGGIAAAALLMALDIIVPSAGLLTMVGLALLVGSAMNLFDTRQAPGAEVSWWAIAAVVGIVVLIALGIGWLAWQAHRRKVSTGAEGLIGRTAQVRQALMPEGMVFVDGALWRAVCRNGVAPEGVTVEVTAVNGLSLDVRIGAADGSAARKELDYGA
jgi:membrane-bound serine protease (ClpP class)